MPEKRTIERAREDAREGKAPSSQAGEFVREEVRHVREGKHGARSSKQAIAIGLSKARRAGVKLRPPAPGKTSARTRKSAERAYQKGQAGGRSQPSPRRSKAVRGALEREGSEAASKKSLSRQTKRAAQRRSASERRAAARKGARTKGPAERSAAARKAARTRAHRAG